MISLEKIAELALNNNHSLTILLQQIVFIVEILVDIYSLVLLHRQYCLLQIITWQ